MNGLASSGLITMDEASCIESTEAGRLMSLFYLDLETMKLIMKIEGTESLERLLVLICESHELADMHLRMDERRCLNLLNRNNAAATIRYPMKGKISTRQMKLNCIIQAVLGCLSIPDPSLNQEAMKIMRIADRVCKCLLTYVTRPDLISQQPQFYSAILNSILLGKCVAAHLWENSPYVSKQLKGIGPTFSTLLASAGKVNFMLLEESHPRDLERIMNKGPPAGNVLRKQVSLLPKYQLTMIPVDEKTVTVQLVLLNQSHLAENMDSLTAGDSHKSYIIVGDSDNNLLKLVAFKDRDLISVFDGTIAHEVRRKHNFEHKIFAHCISSTFVGIDVQSEYSFNDLEPFLRAPTSTTTPTNVKPPKKTSERQTSITDTFKERKRKINPDAIEKSKEKRKRENAIIENFKYLKQSFETASKNISQSINQQSRQNKQLYNENSDACSMSDNKISNANPIETNPIVTDENTCSEDINTDDFIDEEKIDSILNEIENEMTKSKTSLNNTNSNTNAYFREKSLNCQNPFSTKLTGSGLKNTCSENKITNSRSSNYKSLSASRKTKPKTPKSNYNFIELLERKLNISDEEDKTEVPLKDNGFSETIKNQIQKYLTKTQTKTSAPDKNIKMLFNKPEAELLDDDEKANEVKAVDLDCEILNSPTHSTYPRYEIKEIRGDKTYTRQDSYKKTTKREENLINSKDSKICDSMAYTNNVFKHSKNIEVDTTHWDTDMIINLDDKSPRKYSDNELKTGDLDDTLNIDETSEMLTNQENGNREADHCNETDIICVEEYNFKNDNIKRHNSVVNIDPDVIMISPTEVSDKCSDKNNIEINNQHSVEKEQNIVAESIVTEGSNNNPSYVVVDNKVLQNLCESTFTNVTENSLYTDTDIKNRTHVHVNDNASHNTILAIDNSDSKFYQPTKIYESANNNCLDIVQKNNNQLVENDRVWHDKILEMEHFGHHHDKSPKVHDPLKISSLDIVLKSWNEKEINNKRLHEKTLATEESGPNMHPDQAQHNNSLSFMNYNKFSNPSKNLSENKQNHDFVKRYIYSTSKVDVCTKQTPEYNVHVIKKVKMDLDITAIVSRKQNSSQNYETDSEEAPSSNKRMKIDDLPKQSDAAKESNKLIALVSNEMTNTSKVNLPAFRTPRPEFSMDNSVIMEPDEPKDEQSERNILESINENNICESIINENQTKYDNIQIPEVKQEELKEKDNHKNNNEKTGEKLRELETGNSPTKGENNIKNILHKYSKILAKNTVKTATPNCSGINRTVIGNSTSTTKSQKPFKITDINKLHAALPKTIVENKPEVEKYIPQFPIVNRCIESKKNKREDLNSNQYIDCTETAPIEEIPEHESITDLDLEPIHLPANEDLEPLKDYKIDQSMFDPKTLLQTVADDDCDEIVPPPPEFCDGITYSSNYENGETTMANEFDKVRTPPNDFFSDYMEYNESIFDDCTATNLTPSTEIETWNLSQEDSWEPRNAINLSPVKSFTVMRRNTNTDCFSQNTNMSRQAKLAAFRLHQKSKLKIRK